MRDYLDRMKREGAPHAWADKQLECHANALSEIDLDSDHGRSTLARTSAAKLAAVATYSEGLWENLLAIQRDAEDFRRIAARGAFRAFACISALLILQGVLLALILWRVW